jgi:arginine deiminase
VTYKIVRMYFNRDYKTQIIAKGLTLEKAQEHCRNPETSSSTATRPAAVRRTETRGPWFDGYEEE